MPKRKLCEVEEDEAPAPVPAPALTFPRAPETTSPASPTQADASDVTPACTSNASCLPEVSLDSSEPSTSTQGTLLNTLFLSLVAHRKCVQGATHHCCFWRVSMCVCGGVLCGATSIWELLEQPSDKEAKLETE